jgi:hypothetical protein
MANRNVAQTSYFTEGLFFTGLTRDDVGGLRYLLTKKNLNVESTITGTSGAGSSSSPWGSPGGGGVTNAFVDTALRPGVEKILFKQIKYLGLFPTTTNTYTDTYFPNTGNNRSTKQKLQRVLVQPDIVFAAGDLGTFGLSGAPIRVTRTDTTLWANNAATNSPAHPNLELDGPGVIEPPANSSIVIAFTTVGPFYGNTFPGFLSQANNNGFWGGWASFDGTTNAPVLYPNGASIQALEDAVLGGGFQSP